MKLFEGVRFSNIKSEFSWQVRVRTVRISLLSGTAINSGDGKAASDPSAEWTDWMGGLTERLKRNGWGYSDTAYIRLD